MALRGYIDGVIGDELVGWALDEDALARRVLVRGELDGVALGTVEACEPRHDLVTAGFGDGAYGFRIALEPGVLTPGLHRVAAIVGGEAVPLAQDWIVRDGEDRPLESVQLAAAPVATAQAPAAPRRRGRAAAQTRAHQATQPAEAEPAAPEPQIVRAGVAGWTFLVPAAGAARTHAQLDAEAAAIEQLHALADSLGSVALAVAVPAKHVLYAEHLPAEQRTVADRRPARAVAARLRDSDAASLHDLYDALQDARAHGRVYPRSGQALTWAGAIHACRAIVKALPDPRLRPQPVDAFGFGALAPVADALDAEDTEPTLATRPSAPPQDAPTALVIHDGTAGRIAELLRLRFSRCQVVVADRVDPRLLGAAKADIVIWIREDG